MKYIKLFENYTNYTIDELVSLNPKQLGDRLLLEKVLKKPKLVQMILNIGARLDVQDKREMTSLHCAIINDHLQSAKLLIEAGAPLNIRDEDGRTPIYYAVHHPELLQMLCDAGASLDNRDNHGWTPLHYTVEWTHSTEEIKILINAGAPLDAVTDVGYTPWDMAWDGFQEEIPELNPNR